jgi:hypothetical protein
VQQDGFFLTHLTLDPFWEKKISRLFRPQAADRKTSNALQLAEKILQH